MIIIRYILLIMICGILLDVSGSMKKTYDPLSNTIINQTQKSWISSIFKIIKEIAKYDIQEENHIFSIAFGTKNQSQIIDTISTLKNYQKIKQKCAKYSHISKYQKINQIFRILIKSGAQYIRTWTDQKFISENVSNVNIDQAFAQLRENKEFRKQFVLKFLPSQCRLFERNISSDFELPTQTEDLGRGFSKRLFSPIQTPLQAFYSIVGLKKKAQKNDIQKVIQKCSKYFNIQFLAEFSKNSIFSSLEVLEILKKLQLEEQQCQNQQVSKILNFLEPYIYGLTPLNDALKLSYRQFNQQKYQSMQKVLFVLSDGLPDDQNDNGYIKKLKDCHVKIVSLWASKQNLEDPLRLYSKILSEFEPGAKYLFNLASQIETQELPHQIFIKRDWKIDTLDNSTRLFMQINHPKFVDQCCKFIKDTLAVRDSFASTLAEISVSQYIYDEKSQFRAKDQIGDTCYANAAAAIIHIATKRSQFLNKNHPSFQTIRAQIIDQYGNYPNKTFTVLSEVCPKYSLVVKKISNTKTALRAIMMNRPILATFKLTQSEWIVFKKFYEKNPRGVLTKNQFNLHDRQEQNQQKPIGHAVVLMSCDKQSLILMNSWGQSWASNGFFRIQNVQTLNLKLYDININFQKLNQLEKQTFKTKGVEKSQQLFKKLIGLRNLEYKCYLCNQNSFAHEYKGHLSYFICPKCHSKIHLENDGNQLVLYKYIEWYCQLNEKINNQIE